MYILHTVLYTFPEVLTRRICLTIKGFFSGDLFFFLVTLMFNLGVMLWREFKCYSLLGVKGLSAWSLWVALSYVNPLKLFHRYCRKSMWVHCRNKRSWNRQSGICYWGSFTSWNPLSRKLPWHLRCEILPDYTWEVCHTCYMWRWRHSQESIHGTNITCRRCQESLCWRTWTATWGCCFRYGHIAFSSKCLTKGS